MGRKSYNNPKSSGGQKETQSFHVAEKALLMEFLIEQLPHKSRNNIKSLLGHKQVFVDGVPVSQFNFALMPGQKVEIGGIRVAQEQKFREYTILYEDQYLIIIDKAAGLPVMLPEKEKKVSAFGLLKRHIERKSDTAGLYIVYGLDRETSGLMMFAKDSRIKEQLLDNPEGSKAERTYVALVEGEVEQKEGTVDTFLIEDKIFKMHSSYDPSKGKRAVTHYTVIRKNNHYSLLNVTTETHLKNQIRIHLQEIGHTIVGDRKYGAVDSPIKRLGLHVHQLSVIHPVSGKQIKIETKIPKSFLRLFQE